MRLWRTKSRRHKHMKSYPGLPATRLPGPGEVEAPLKNHPHHHDPGQASVLRQNLKENLRWFFLSGRGSVWPP